MKKRWMTGAAAILLLCCFMKVFAAGAASGAQRTDAMIENPGREGNEAEGQLGKNEVRLPILMYHRISARSEDWGKYCISPYEFEYDLKYLKSQGYTAVGFEELVGYISRGEALPQKIVMLSFDDGTYCGHKYAFPLLQKYGMKGVMSVICSEIDHCSSMEDGKEYYPYVTWPQMKEMGEAGVFEFQNHTYNLHIYADGYKGVLKRECESEQEYYGRVLPDIEKAQERMTEMLGIAPVCFTYPFGAKDEFADRAVRDLEFLASLSCYEGVNTIARHDSECLFDLKRCIRPHDLTAQDIFDAMGL